jgi:hypothetical protein
MLEKLIAENIIESEVAFIIFRSLKNITYLRLQIITIDTIRLNPLQISHFARLKIKAFDSNRLLVLLIISTTINRQTEMLTTYRREAAIFSIQIGIGSHFLVPLISAIF